MERGLHGGGEEGLRQLTDPCAVVGLGFQIRHFSDLLEEVGLLHPTDAAKLSPRVGKDHLEVDGKTWKLVEEGEDKGGGQQGSE